MDLIKKYLNNYGYCVIRYQNHLEIKDKKNRELNKKIEVKDKIINEIFMFYEYIKPFYDKKIRSELQISGGWKEYLKKLRKNQIYAIETRDKKLYKSLLENMYRNELNYGLWNYEYFNKKTIGGNLPIRMLLDLEKSSSLCNLKLEDMVDGSFGNPFGIKTKKGILTYMDGPNSYYATFCARILKNENLEKNTFMDLGSGRGTLALKVSKFFDKPLRIILLDLPLNLTTAYAYVKMNSDKKCYLLSKKNQLNFLTESNFKETHFVFVPTSLSEDLAKNIKKIDLLFNHGSFSEMDYETIRFYLNLFAEGKSTNIYEINANKKIRSNHITDFIEVPSSSFEISQKYRLVSNGVSVTTDRYVQNHYQLISK